MQPKRESASDRGQPQAPAIVHDVLASPGRHLDASARGFFEQRFGYDLGHVQVHTDAKAAQSARLLDALAYTVGNDIVFGRGQYAPGTEAGRRLLAHELTHVEQQGRAGGEAGVVRRTCSGPATGGNSIASGKEADYIAAVKQGKYCRDTGITGVFHGGRCYREVPPSKHGFPGGDQVCFDSKTGACAEDSPDVVSAVEGTNSDGSCNLKLGRSLGHFAEDILPSEPGIIGGGFGLLAGSALGYAHERDLAGVGVGAAAGVLTGLMFGRKGYVPVVGGSIGIANPVPNLTGDATWQARLYIGAAQRRPLLKVLYPEFKFGVSLIGEAQGAGGEKVGPSAVASLAPGIRVDPGEAGGHYVSFFGGPALAVGKGNVAIGKEAGFAVGKRWRWIGIEAQAGYLSDPTRPEGSDKLLRFGIGVEFGPDKP